MRLHSGMLGLGGIGIALVMSLMSSNNAMLSSILEVVDDVYFTAHREISGIVDGCLDGNVSGQTVSVDHVCCWSYSINHVGCCCSCCCDS